MAVDDHSVNNFPSFFKIILDLQKLGIPKKFMTDYGNDLLDVVSLKVPTGKTWAVELLKEDGRAWFSDGWPEFVNYYSICHFHFLMFTYGGNSQFNVFIFDKTACEIEYPLDLEKTIETQKRMSETKSKTNSSSPSFSAKENGMVALVRQYRRKFGTLTHGHIKKISSCRFENPSFTVIMRPSYVGYRFCMSVPIRFAAEHLSNKQGSVTLEDPTGGTWLVKCIGKQLSGGWKEFALDNNLRVGDICVFELIKASKPLFKVEIIRCSSRVVVAGSSSSKKSSDVEIDVILIED